MTESLENAEERGRKPLESRRAGGGDGWHEFGPYRVDPAKRLLTRSGEVLELSPKAFDLLLLLVESGGRVLTKSELLDALWPGTFVEESNLTFQISTLRKALGGPGVRWIETVPKHGYRFAGPAGRSGRRTRWWAAAMVLVTVLAAGGLVLALRRAGRSVPPAPAPLTAYPGMELQPSLSPDGGQVAFAWDGPGEDNFDIYVKLVGPGEPMRLTSDPAPEFSPSWSPDGRWIAFFRGLRHVGLYVIPALGGAAERKIADLVQPTTMHAHRIVVPNANVAWTPDSRWLAVIGAQKAGEPTALWLVSLENGRMWRLTQPPRGWLGDLGPAFSPDGRMLAFVRLPAISSGQLHVVPLSRDFRPAGASRTVTAGMDSIEAPVWTADSRQLVFSAGPTFGIRLLHLVSVAGSSAKPEVLAIGQDATTISLSRTSRIVYSRLLRDVNIWSLDLDQPGSAPRRFIASTRDDYTPDYSPDGRKIVFASTRSGSSEIWLANANGSNPTQLTSIGGPLTSNPRWSPDGTTIVFDSRISGVPQLYTLDPVSREMRRLTSRPWRQNEPCWSRDGKWIYFQGGGTDQVWKASRNGGDVVQVTSNGAWNAQESVDGRYLYFSKPGWPSSLWRRPTGDGEEAKIAESLSPGYNFAVVEKGVYFMAERGPKRIACIRYYDSFTGRITELLDTGKQVWHGFTVSPDRRRLLYSVLDSHESDLMVADGLR
jgi:Tol biopolymer transport system component/DNA-binding winged helix-turn-helix (wHTH) protein